MCKPDTKLLHYLILKPNRCLMSNQNPIFNMATPLLVALIVMIVGLASPNVSYAACTPSARKAIKHAAQVRLAHDSPAVAEILNEMSDAPPSVESSYGLSWCSSNDWPSMFPSAMSILAGIAQSIIDQACEIARDYTHDKMEPYMEKKGRIEDIIGDIQA